MPMFLSKISPKRSGRPSRTENGFSLLELLVAMGIFAVIAAATVSVIVLLNNSAVKFQNTTTTQNELNTAMSRIQVDISQSTSLAAGAKNYVALNSTQNAGTAYKTYIFYYDGTTDNIPDGANTDNLPPSNRTKGAIIEQVFQGDVFKAQTILVGGYQPSASWKNFFQFYSANGTQYGKTGDKLSTDDLAEIVKIQFSLQSKVADRTTPIELASAAAINSYVQGLSYTGNQPQIPAATVLRGNLTYEDNNAPLFDGKVTGNLNWDTVAGADSYTIYRINQGVLERRTVVLDPTKSTWSEDGLKYGETYEYYIVVNGASGQSIESNHWSMTVRPPKTVIINQNTLKNLPDTKPSTDPEVGDVSGTPVLPNYKYTVARDLTNQITWAPSNGALGYLIYRNGQMIQDVKADNSSPASSYTVTDKAAPVTYGAVNTYTVIPYNTGQNFTGGKGVESDSATLVSPPTAPVISADQSDGTSGTLYNTVNVTSPGASAAGTAYVKINLLYTRGVGQGATLNCVDPAASRSANTNNVANTGQTFARTGNVQHAVGFGQANCYQITAQNDAGQSPFSNAVVTHTRPSAFSIVNKNVNANLNDTAGNGEVYTVARGLTNQVSWTGSTGASGYYVYRDNNLVATINGAGTHSWRDGNLSYGDIHTYRVTAFSKWGDDSNYQRTTDATNDPDARLVSPPVAPGIGASAYGSDSGNPYNTVTLTNTVANADGYRLYSVSDTGSVPDCGNPNYTGQDFGTNQGSQINNGVNWGSATCYRARAYNAAGEGPWSNIPTVYVGPAGFDLQNTNARGVDLANLDQSANGYRYTVAKDLTDQVVWNYTAGADQYTVTRNGGDVSTVGSGTNFYREGRNYGDQYTFRVRATSTWSGTNFTISRDTYNSKFLQSPPNAPSISAVAQDQNTSNSTSQNNLYLNGYGGGSNTTSVRFFGWSSGNATTGCNSSGSSTWSYPRDDMGSIYNLGFRPTEGSQANYDTVNWGTSSCYYATAYNDAGQGLTSGSSGANQRPGAFDWSGFSNKYRYMNINSTKSSTTTCIGDRGNVDYCYYGNDDDDNYGNEQFDTISSGNYNRIYTSSNGDTSADMTYALNWSGARGVGNAANGAYYKIDYNNVSCSRTVRDRADGRDITDSGVTNYDERTLSPGCLYNAAITAYANNGLTRGASSNRAEFVTAPNVPSTGDNYILRVNSDPWGRRLQSVATNTGSGSRDFGTQTIYNGTKWTSGTDSGKLYDDTHATDASGPWNVWTSRANPSGSLKSTSYAQSIINYGVTTKSLKLNFTGSIGQGSCYNSCTSSFGTQQNPNSAAFLAEGSYTDKYHPRYYTRD